MNRLKKMLRAAGLVLLIALVLAAWILLPWWVLLGAAAAFALWMLLARSGRQAASVTMVGVSTLSQRIGSSSVVIVGIAGVVGVLVALLAMAEGYRHTVSSSGDERTAIVLRGGSAAELMSVMTRDAITTIERAPEIARDADGRPMASPELVVAANLPVRGGGADEDGSVQLRGVGDMAWAVRPDLEIVEGRRFEPGKRELVVGKGARRQFTGLDPGSELRLGTQPWTVVGVFESGDSMESEIWADAEVVASTYGRGSSRASVFARLSDPSAFNAFKATLAADPRLQVEAKTTLDYFQDQSEGVSKVLRIIGIVVGSIMAIGAVFGALNTMFASVASRAREIATLRAIGFRGVPVVVAVLLETMLLAALGGALGGAIAWLVFNGYTASTLAGGVAQLSFEFKVSPALLWEGLKWALAIGFVGGLFPALRAATMPVTDALRAA
ncbi:ABC transporter permease [Luteimonas sp. MC1825]|uniref:ABC transporter permease n=1 Tax=Luteimonas sp. MC1825 TaxID=2761107 RepID=UPI0016176A65|nr:ABC transporter permease [Luteimonas sp. MC1825]MBB6600220.1 ABC transporter permease [Luteimonas sp. MC1825]QOC87907.1 ABC transporter permease [Luteimonas sp. MC1825]